MAEPPSRTSNHQRLDEMMVHLTPLGAVVPYSLCRDSVNHLWVGSKGGLLKLDTRHNDHDDPTAKSGGADTKRKIQAKILLEQKNPFPKRVSPYVQVLHYDSKIIYAFTDDKERVIDFRILDLSGEILHQQFIDGRVQSMAVGANGELFMTKQLAAGEDESIIYRSSVDCPLAWEELSSAYDFAFQALCVYDADTLAVATVSTPINLYSKQAIKWISTRSGKILGTFSCAGKSDGQIYFPRCMRRYKDDLLVMDKTGRFQRFTRVGELVEVAASIDAYIGNGFMLEEESHAARIVSEAEENGPGRRGYMDGEVIVACSGIVLSEEKESLCDDWLERVRLDGSKWTM